MLVYRCLFVLIIIRLTTAQTHYGRPRRMMPIAGNAWRSSTGTVRSSNGLPINNPFLRNMPATRNSGNIANMNLANNIFNRNLNGYGNPNIAEANMANPTANQILATNINDAKAIYASENIAGGNVMPVADTPAIFPNNNAQSVTNSAVTNGNIANHFNNMASGYDPKTLKLKIGNPYGNNNGINGKIGNQNFGLQITADNLEIAGTVSVTGKMPIYGTVTINGNVPSDGTASVNYNCGSQKRIIPTKY